MTHIVTHNQLAELCSYLPYVTLLPLDRPYYCDGWKRNGKCLNRAWWQFKKSSTKGRGRAKSGRYCDYHLLKSGIHYSKYETARADRAFAKSVKEDSHE